MAVEPGDDQFQSKLSEKSRKLAREELNELNDMDRKLAVQSFRQWVLQQKWLRTPTDFRFLLRFLRAKKYSQLVARETLENYWSVKSSAPEWFRDVNPADPIIQEILRTGVYFCPKVYDKQGRRVIFDSLGKVDMNLVKKKWGVNNLMKAICLACDWINRDENVQVNGLLVFIDYTDVTMSHMMTVLGKENGPRLISFYLKSLPARVKGMHIYNEPAFFDVAYAMISPVMKQKHKDRLHLHGRSMVNVYEQIDQELLPDEYLPDDYEGKSIGSASSAIEEMIADMNTPEFLSYIRDISSEKYGVDLKAKPKDKDVPVASFRKLNVD